MMTTHDDPGEWPSRQSVVRLFVVYLTCAASAGLVMLLGAASLAHPGMVLPFCVGLAMGLTAGAFSRAAQRRAHGWQRAPRHRAI
jgi:hypothetical protein